MSCATCSPLQKNQVMRSLSEQDKKSKIFIKFHFYPTLIRHTAPQLQHKINILQPKLIQS